MKQEFNKFRSLDDNALQRDVRRTNPPKSPLDHLDLATRHEIFFRKIEDQNSPKSLPGGNNQKHWDTNQQDKVAEEQKRYKKNDGTAGELLTQSETNRREEIDSAGIPKRESPGSYLDAIKSLSSTDVTQLVKGTMDWIRQNGVKSLSGKSLTQLAKETMDWAWQNGIKSLSGKSFMQLMVIGLAVSRPYTVDAVKIYGKNGCSIDSQLIIDEHLSSYDNAHHAVTARFNERFTQLVERYAKDPCDKKFEKIRVTLDPKLSVLGTVYDEGETPHVFLRAIESEHTKQKFSIGRTALHEFSHIPQGFVTPPLDKDFPGSAVRWVGEARAEYNVFIYGTKQDIEYIPFPPNLKSIHHYMKLDSPTIAGSFMLWLDKQFPGFVDKSSQLAMEKLITWEDLEQLTDGQPLKDLWEEYKKIDFAAEMSQFIKEQRQKHLGSDQHTKDEL